MPSAYGFDSLHPHSKRGCIPLLLARYVSSFFRCPADAGGDAGLTSEKGGAFVLSAGRRTPPFWPLPGGRVQPSSDIAVLLLRSTAATRRASLTLPLLDRLRASAITSASPATRHHRLLPGHSPQSPLDPATKPPSPPPPPPLRPSDWSSIKFCQSPARLTPFRSSCGAPWVRR